VNDFCFHFCERLQDLWLELLYELFLWTDLGDGPATASPSSSVGSADFEEGEALQIEFDTALPVEHNVSICGVPG
jgi:hypothetical protein